MKLNKGLFFPMLSSEPKLQFEIESCQHFDATHTAGGFDSSPWGRPADVAIIQYTYSGRGCVQFRDSEYEQVAGNLFVIHTEPKHRYFLPKDSTHWNFISFTIKGKSIIEWVRSIIEEFGISHQISPSGTALGAIESLFNQISNEVMVDPYSISTETYKLMMRLQQELKSDHSTRVTHLKIQKAINYIQTKYRQKLSLDDIAKECGLSRFHLTRLFKAQTGTTTRDYVEKVRIQHAKQMLIDASYTIGEVAAWTGFSEQAYFANVFRQRVGQSPSEYRQSARALGGYDSQTIPREPY